jgi:hypothetical protein
MTQLLETGRKLADTEVEAVCETLAVRMLGDEPRGDDVCLLVARRA